MFSRRLPEDLSPNRLSLILARLREEPEPVLDLTESNPTRADLHYPADLLAPLANPRGLSYRPEPFGVLEARRAVAADFARRGTRVEVADIALTASTSDAYSAIFKVLCDPGDQVLVPRPSYPLFEHLTRLDAVEPVPYDLEYHGAWTIDLDSVARAFTARTRAVLIVNPNNPTGSFVSSAEVAALGSLCQSHEAAIIADEVFADYELTPGAAARSGRLSDRHDVLGFTLGGLSKSIGLPQAKLAWIALSGSADVVHAARVRLEMVCDTYLSVSTVVQGAAAELLEQGGGLRRQIHDRIRANLGRLRAMGAAAGSCSVLNCDAGWYAVVQVPALMSEEDLVLSLLQEDRVLIHPGYFFDFPKESFLVASLLPPPATFDAALGRVFRRFPNHPVGP